MRVTSSSMDNLGYRPTRQSQKKVKDLFQLKLHISLLTFLGICPFGRNFIKAKIYSLCLLTTLSAATLLSFNRSGFNNGLTAMIEKFLPIISNITLLIFFNSILLSSLRCRKSWKITFSVLLKFDGTFFGRTLAKRRENKFRVLLYFLLCHFAFVVYTFIDPLLLIMALKKKMMLVYPAFLIQHIGIYYQFTIAYFFWEFAKTVESRYKFLEGLLQDVFLNTKHDFPRAVIRNDIQKIKSKYKLLYTAVQEINTIFGWIIIFFLCHAIAIFLLAFYSIVFTFDPNPQLYIEACIIGILSMVSFQKT